MLVVADPIRKMKIIIIITTLKKRSDKIAAASMLLRFTEFGKTRVVSFACA